MKRYIYMLGLLGYWHNSYGACTARVLGRTTQRLPSTDANAFIQQELPVNTVHQQCSYTTGGVVLTYPSGWFTGAPNVRATVQPTDPSSTIQYATQIVSNSATSTTIRVVTYQTSDACDAGICDGGICADAPYCAGGVCIPSSATSTCPSCNGSCSNTCTACAATTCLSRCTNCNGSCEGFCTGSGTNCIGASVTCVECDGLGVGCVGGCAGTLIAEGCAGVGTTCNSCQGTCTSFTDGCNGNSDSCNSCQGNGVCATGIGSCMGSASCSYALFIDGVSIADGFGNGPAGSCLFTVEGTCSEVDANSCNGLCSLCASPDPTGQGRQAGCNGIAATNAPCNGYCTICTGSCEGLTFLTSGVVSGIPQTDNRFVPPCKGTVTGRCSRLGGTEWNGEASGCYGSCTGNGTVLAGATCIHECNAANTAVEAAVDEVIVHVYAIADI